MGFNSLLIPNKGRYILLTMSPLVTFLMMLMVMVINTKAAPNPGTDTDEDVHVAEILSNGQRTKQPNSSKPRNGVGKRSPNPEYDSDDYDSDAVVYDSDEYHTHDVSMQEFWANLKNSGE